MNKLLQHIKVIIVVACLLCLTFSATVWAVKEINGFSEKKTSSKEATGVGTFSAPVAVDGTVMSVAEFQTLLKKRGYYKGKIDGKVSKDYINSLTQTAWDKAYNDQCGVEDYKTSQRPERAPIRDKYIIRWKSKITGKTGGGLASFPKEIAVGQVAKQNRQHPDIEHWYEAALGGGGGK